MNDLLPGNENYPSTNTLAKQGMTAVGGIVGGAVLMIMRALPPVLGIIAGLVVGILGIGGIISKDKDDRKFGLLATVAGGLSILSRIGIIRPLAGTLLSISALGMLVVGAWSGIKFFKGLKRRS
ncbi:hypothetical protein TREPR_1729 [Treponema primitia ZAS-2]|uniref:Transmembrane protein n=1 Tax=Treponema primitia (strain ATCC BAA-887 / DSM 12427 / ZAS-2) TaxID=545694 RepID=F5YMU1_TREPZ|nr:hypothetical protein [Treponema primitia]AEF83716.1 hypothetical protein TREPR_1729 [Treponema primitia ZAS-2]